MSGRLFSMVMVAMMANGVLLWRTVSMGGQFSTPQLIIPKPSPEKMRDPRVHLPLAGMTGFSGSTADGCMRMEGFVLDIVFALAQTDAPIIDHKAFRDALATSACTIDDPVLAATLSTLHGLWLVEHPQAAWPLD
jgi:hypothetical protein